MMTITLILSLIWSWLILSACIASRKRPEDRWSGDAAGYTSVDRDMVSCTKLAGHEFSSKALKRRVAAPSIFPFRIQPSWVR